MFVSLLVFSLMFAGRAVSYEFEDYDEDEEVLQTYVYAKNEAILDFIISFTLMTFYLVDERSVIFQALRY